MRFLLAILVLLYSNIVFGKEFHEIRSLFIESTARTVYEAQSNALAGGMLRAFHILSNKYGVDSSRISNIPICTLENIFTVTEIRNERQTENSYKANVSLGYNLGKFKKVLYDYGNQEIKKQFFQYLVIPAFKLNAQVELYNDRAWFTQWEKYKEKLLHNAFIHIDTQSALFNTINIGQLQKITYANIADHINDKLFNKILLALCEYQTDIHTGASYIEISLIEIDENQQKQVTTKQYPIQTYTHIQQTIEKIINAIIDQYGITVQDCASPQRSELGFPNVIIVQIASDDLGIITSKLDKMTLIRQYNVDNNVISIVTNESEEKLFLSLYREGLVCYKNGSTYTMSVIREGC